MDKDWDEMHHNPPENWREIWSPRDKRGRFDILKQAQKYADKNGYDDANIGIHPKDGYVIYYD